MNNTSIKKKGNSGVWEGEAPRSLQCTSYSGDDIEIPSNVWPKANFTKARKREYERIEFLIRR